MVCAVLSFVPLWTGWDHFGLVPIGKEVIFLQSLCCLQLGPLNWECFPWTLFSHSLVLVSIFLPNKKNWDLLEIWFFHNTGVLLKMDKISEHITKNYVQMDNKQLKSTRWIWIIILCLKVRKSSKNLRCHTACHG